MYLSFPDKNFHWTDHAKLKMRQYNLSSSRVLRVFFYPKRKEKGIAPRTLAVMQPYGNKKNTKEIWVMYQTKRTGSKNQKTKIISAWRYPGVSPVGREIPIPEDIKSFVQNYNAKLK